MPYLEMSVLNFFGHLASIFFISILLTNNIGVQASILGWESQLTEGRTRRLIHIWKANAVLLRLYHSVVIKRELSNTAKLSDFKSVIIYSHESWGMSEKILSQVQAAEMGLLRRVHGVTLHDEVPNHENCKALNVELLLRIEKYQLR